MRNQITLAPTNPIGELPHPDAVRLVIQHLSISQDAPVTVVASLRAKFQEWIVARYEDKRDKVWRAHQVQRFEAVLSEATAGYEKRRPAALTASHNQPYTHEENAEKACRRGGVFFKLGANDPAQTGKTVEVIITAEPVSSDGRAEFAVGYATSVDGESGLCRYRLEEGSNVYSFRCATGKRHDDTDPLADYLGIWPDTNARGNSVLISDVIVREVGA
ncbi:MAG: hypothetical protein AAFY99_11470 [Pseudomonadota bacterium]